MSFAQALGLGPLLKLGTLLFSLGPLLKLGTPLFCSVSIGGQRSDGAHVGTVMNVGFAQALGPFSRDNSHLGIGAFVAVEIMPDRRCATARAAVCLDAIGRTRLVLYRHVPSPIEALVALAPHVGTVIDPASSAKVPGRMRACRKADSIFSREQGPG